MEVPRSNRPQNVVNLLSLMNVSLNVAVASSKLSSWVSSGIAEMNRSVRFSSPKGCGHFDAGFWLGCRRSSRAVRVAPPVMRMGVS